MYFNCVDFIYCVSMFVYTIMLLAVCHIVTLVRLTLVLLKRLLDLT